MCALLLTSIHILVTSAHQRSNSCSHKKHFAKNYQNVNLVGRNSLYHKVHVNLVGRNLLYLLLKKRVSDKVSILERSCSTYHKVANSRLPWLVAHIAFFRLLMKGILDAYVL